MGCPQESLQQPNLACGRRGPQTLRWLLVQCCQLRRLLSAMLPSHAGCLCNAAQRRRLLSASCHALLRLQ